MSTVVESSVSGGEEALVHSSQQSLLEFLGDGAVQNLAEHPRLLGTERVTVRARLSRGLRRRQPDGILAYVPETVRRTAARRRRRLSKILCVAKDTFGWVPPSTECLSELARVTRKSLPVSTQREILLDPILRACKTANGMAAYITIRLDAIRAEKARRR